MCLVGNETLKVDSIEYFFMKDKITNEFLISIKEIEPLLLKLEFHPHSYFEKGLAYYIEYKSKISSTIIEFLFGPSDWNVEMIIYSTKGKFAFKDLLNVSEINKWVYDNIYNEENGRNIKNELLWSIELLKVALPYIE